MVDIDDMFDDDIMDKPTLTIGAAAGLAGIHPQTLRLWEQKGIIEPHRTEGGTRMYSMNDLNRIARIQQLSAEGVNMTGIQRIFALEDRVAGLVQQCSILSNQNKKMSRVLQSIMAQSDPDGAETYGFRPKKPVSIPIEDAYNDDTADMHRRDADSNANNDPLPIPGDDAVAITRRKSIMPVVFIRRGF